MLGAFLAKKMGLPIERLICASNENNILTDFLNIGVFDLRNRNLKETISPAIDILVPSNLERLLYFITNDTEKIKTWFEELKTNNYFKIDDKTLEIIKSHFIADYCTEKEQIETIYKTYTKNNIIIDPHTSV